METKRKRVGLYRGRPRPEGLELTMGLEGYMTPEAAAKLTGIQITSALRLARSGRILSQKVERYWFLHEAALRRYYQLPAKEVA